MVSLFRVLGTLSICLLFACPSPIVDNGGGGGGGSVTTIVVTSVNLNKIQSTMLVAGTETFFAQVSPSNASDKTITWSSSNGAVATVNSSGMVTATGLGTAKITAKNTKSGKLSLLNITVSGSV